MPKTKVSLVTRLIDLLSDGKWHTSQELAEKISFRFGATIHTARKSGYNIESNRIENQDYEYRLIPK